MKLDRSHDFSLEEGLARLRALTDYWQSKHGVGTRWDGSTAHISGKVRGIKFEGVLTVENQRLHGEVKVNFLAEKLGGRDYVERKLADYLDPKNSVEQLQARL